MIPYGNTRTRLTGIIHDIQQSRANIEFKEVKKQLSVPMYFIHSPIHVDPHKEQEMEIEEWFLKQNRVISLL